MSKSGICIICRNHKDNLSDEHVIPDSIGGYYHIYTVCKECNSNLGNNVDSKLVNHYFTDFMRYDLGLKGKTGKIPNPFEGTHVLDTDPNTKVKLDTDPNGNLITHILPKTTITRDDNNGKTNISIQLDSSDESKKDKILEKILEREGLNTNSHTVNKLQPIKNKFLPIIKMERTIDVKEFRIAFLKIAYEFAIDTIPEYFEDKQAIEISKILLNADCSNIDKYFMGNGFDQKIPEHYSQMIDFEKNRHILILSSSKGLGLICFISLYNLFTFAVILSDNSHNCLMHIGINDLENKRFDKLDIFEAVRKLYPFINYTYEFFFQTEKECIEFQNLQLSNDFSYYSINDNIPIFDNNFNIKYFNTELVKRYFELNPIELNNSFEHKFFIGITEKLYIQILPSNKYIQLTGIEVERKLVKI